MDKNRISDTDSFWDQLDGNQQAKAEKTASPFAAEREDGSVAIDRNQLLQAVEQLRDGRMPEVEVNMREQKTGREKGEDDIFAAPSKKSTSVKERKKSNREKQTSLQKENRKNRENREKRVAARENDGSVTMSRNTVIAIVTAAVVCVGSFLGIFWKLNADKQEILGYIETELADIRAINDAAIAEMKDTLDTMETNFDEIVSLLEETGAAIGSSSQESRAAISERIEKLDKQLQSLQKSLAILQEDANGRKK